MTYAWLLPALLLTASAATVVDDKFADGDSQNQDLENNSLRLFNGRTTTVRTDQAGSVTFDVTATGASSGRFVCGGRSGREVSLAAIHRRRNQRPHDLPGPRRRWLIRGPLLLE